MKVYFFLSSLIMLASHSLGAMVEPQGPAHTRIKEVGKLVCSCKNKQCIEPELCCILKLGILDKDKKKWAFYIKLVNGSVPSSKNSN